MKVPKKEKKNHIHKNGSNTSYSKYSVMSKRLEDISNNPHKIFPVSNDVFFFLIFYVTVNYLFINSYG